MEVVSQDLTVRGLKFAVDEQQGTVSLDDGRVLALSTLARGRGRGPIPPPGRRWSPAPSTSSWPRRTASDPPLPRPRLDLAHPPRGRSRRWSAWLRDGLPATRPASTTRARSRGWRSRQAREQVAALLGARSREVVFTSGATEAIADAVYGATARGRGRPRGGRAVEHSAVRLSSARARAHAGRLRPPRAGRPRRPARRHPARHRPRPPAVGQPRGRHHATGGRGGGRVPGAGRARARRRRAGRRARPDRLPAPWAPT